MGEGMEGIVQRVNEVFTEEALAANDGGVIPLTLEPGGPVIGEAKLKYDAEEKALRAEFSISDPKIAEFLQGPPPHIFDQG